MLEELVGDIFISRIFFCQFQGLAYLGNTWPSNSASACWISPPVGRGELVENTNIIQKAP